MLENLYTTQMSTDKEAIRTRFENIQRKPRKTHMLVGLLAFLTLLAGLTAGTVCLAVSTAQDTTLTPEEYAAFLDQPWGYDMADLDYAAEDLLIFHFKEVLCCMEPERGTILRMVDLSDLNLPDDYRVEVAQDGSTVYLCQDRTRDCQVLDLTNGQVKRGQVPPKDQLFQGRQNVSIQGLGQASQNSISLENSTYYLYTCGSLFRELQLVTRYDDGRPDQSRYLFAEPVDRPTGHFGELSFQVGDYLTSAFSRVYGSHYEILEEAVTDFAKRGEEATFRFLVAYREPGAPDTARKQMAFTMKVIRDGNGLTFYRNAADWGGTGWVPTEVEDLLDLP